MNIITVSITLIIAVLGDTESGLVRVKNGELHVVERKCSEQLFYA